jgi:hypothetical protein
VACLNKDFYVILLDCWLVVSRHPEGPATGLFYRPSFVLKLPVAALPCTGAHTERPRVFVHGVVTVPAGHGRASSLSRGLHVRSDGLLSRDLSSRNDRTAE